MTSPMEPRVAVVIPCYNDGGLATEAVRSVRELEPVEIVIVDDGSQDRASHAALDALEAEGVKVVRQANAGPGAARTTGMHATSARYVFPLDSDDLVEAGALADLADALDAQPQASLAWGDYLLFGEFEGRYRAPKAFFPWSVTYTNRYPISSMVRRTALEAAGGWHDSEYEDWGLWLRFVELGLIQGVAVDRIVYRRRLHGSQRLMRDYRARHQELYGKLHQRHPDAFGRRREWRRIERPAVWKRAAYPIVFGRRSVIPVKIEGSLQRLVVRWGVRL